MRGNPREGKTKPKGRQTDSASRVQQKPGKTIGYSSASFLSAGRNASHLCLSFLSACNSLCISFCAFLIRDSCKRRSENKRQTGGNNKLCPSFLFLLFHFLSFLRCPLLLILSESSFHKMRKEEHTPSVLLRI